jgi:hypothetical protein
MNKNSRSRKRAAAKIKPNKDGVVSANPRRNMQMKVLRNKGEDGKSASLTVHVPMDENRFVTYPNHNYMAEQNRYKQPATARY